ncbi:MAG: MBL fold metallo-hydrolase [Fusobacteriaceae bacterium]|jgi:L-ascorbate metabolism protein UlaG (beta-lactamase superfamily)|nr:MBL fold metallo-hydrolase [Fusobacteriaceae bacterium]
MAFFFFLLLLVLAGSGCVFLRHPKFGRLPLGERLARIEKSPNYRDGVFHNETPTPVMAVKRPPIRSMLKFLFSSRKNLRPKSAIPSVKTDLKALDPKADVLVWLGHSSLYLQLNGKRILVDPVLFEGAPLSFFNMAFPGTEIYKPEDFPDIDYLLITHDHWDHLDYKAMKALKDRIGKVVCGLGVGEHLAYWGFPEEKIVELDWNEKSAFTEDFTIDCLPARHFSGRKFTRNKSLWVGWIIETPAKKIYISGDSGYDGHFAKIREKYGKIDLAILENGQYNPDWRYIHMLPEDLVKAAKDIDATRLFTVHNSKYILSTHTWREPLDKIAENAEKENLPLITPMIGEVVRIGDRGQTFQKWWENVK